MSINLKKLVRRILYKTPMRPVLLHRYEYFFWPRELAFLCTEMERCLPLQGAVLEVGCARGATTVFLNKHIDCLNTWDQAKKVSEKNYICLDTFSGFTAEHVKHEKEVRGRKEVFDDFRLNDIEWFKATLIQNGVHRASAVQADAATYDYSVHGNICFALVDVDLYLPIIQALPKIYERLSPGGTIIVDDCQESQKFDGARQAYMEFIKSIGQQPRFEHRKFGMISKP